jgi:hypothetical protein
MTNDSPACHSILRELELAEITDPDRLPENLMQHYFSVLTDAVGVVHINRQTGGGCLATR